MPSHFRPSTTTDALVKCRCFSDVHPFRALLKWQDPKLFYELPFNPQCCGFNHVFIFPNFEHRNDFEHTLTVVKQTYFWEIPIFLHFSQVFEMFEADSSLRRPPVGPNEVRCDSVLGAGRGGSGGKCQGVKQHRWARENQGVLSIWNHFIGSASNTMVDICAKMGGLP